MVKKNISSNSGIGRGFDFSINLRGILLIIIVLAGAGVQVFQTQQSIALNGDVANSINLISQVDNGITLFDQLEVNILELMQSRQQILISSLSNVEAVDSGLSYDTVVANIQTINDWFDQTNGALGPIRDSSIKLPVNYQAPDVAGGKTYPKNSFTNFTDFTGQYANNSYFVVDYNFEPIEYQMIKELAVNRLDAPSFKNLTTSLSSFVDQIAVDNNDLKNTTSTLYRVGSGNNTGTFELIEDQMNQITSTIDNSRLNATTLDDFNYLSDYSNQISTLQIHIQRLASQISNVLASLRTATVSEQTSLLSSLDLGINVQKAQIQSDFFLLKNGLGNDNATRDSDLTDINILEDLLLTNATFGLLPLTQRLTTSVLNILNTATNLNKFLRFDVPATVDFLVGLIKNVINSMTDDLIDFKVNFAQFYLTETNLSIFLNYLVIVFLILAVAIVIPLILTVTKLTGKLDNGFSLISHKNLNIQTFDKYSNGEIGRIQQGYDTMVLELRNILKKMQASSRTLSEIAESMAASSQEASASINQVSDTISTIALGASNQTEGMTRISESLQSHLEEVQSLSDRIISTSEFVKKVAKRTNILGLNASIEAAKAGHFGGGFSVVAENVRDLSDDTKGSAIEIAELIEDVSFRINRTIQNVMNEVAEMKEITENTAAGTEEANASSSEQVSMLSEVSEQSAEISRIASELDSIMRTFQF